ncbi:hypothetical protein ASG37_10205 [Sphingomonas sp. Leaf407]|uniref:hypothetical protein n=1 Tax=unclassified Sphingomonas TaxID=196159 RepID=UPI0006F42802|nr:MULTISPECIES: hypothetical protein [unclassified Sphingomonas]KQN37418.1 hypothetical protein ASE97_07495 [Sphingomonas sp. Leaf42]KQT27787.1 hypothetical protein ASG37_10205 [Sphingomonas sp. Leaf407]
MAFDALWLLHRQAPAGPPATHIELDSLAMVVPSRRPAARLVDGRWDMDPRPDAERPFPGLPRLAYVSLAPDPTLGHAVRMIRDLRQRGICNVLIREGGSPYSVSDFPGGRDRDLQIPALVLCGEAIGDG